MKNYEVTIVFHTHCNEEDIIFSKKKIFNLIKLNYWNINYKEMTWKESNAQKESTKTRPK
jgi:hypothetical protein